MSQGLESVLRGFERAVETWIGWVQRFAWFVVVLTAGLSWLLSAYTIDNIRINTSTTDMLSEELRFRQLYIEYKDAFPQLSDLITVVVEADTPDRADAAALALADRLRNAPEVIDKVYDIAGDPFFRRNGLLYRDIGQLEDQADRLSRSQGFLGALAEDPSLRGLSEVLGLAIDDLRDGNQPPGDLANVLRRIAEVVEARAAGENRELSWQALLSGEEPDKNNHRRFLQVKAAIDWSSLAPAAKAMREIRQMARDMGLVPENGVRVRLTGGAALSTEELQSVFEGAKSASILSLVLVSLCLLIGLRSLKLVVATLLTLIAGLIATAAFATWAVGHLNLLSVAFAVLFIGLGVDFGIHFSLRLLEEQRSLPPKPALRRAAAGVSVALALCAVSAAIGFYSFLPTAYLGLAELGMISGTGMFFALFVSLTVLPALLTLMPVRQSPGYAKSAVFSRSADFVVRRGKGVTVVILLIAAASAVVAPAVRFDFDPLHLNDPDMESVRTTLELIRDSDNSPKTISVLTQGPGQAEELAARLEPLPEVSKAVSFNAFVPDNQDDKLAIIEDLGFVMLPVSGSREAKPRPTAEEAHRSMEGLREKLDKLSKSRETPEKTATAADRLSQAIGAYFSRNGTSAPAVRKLGEALLALLPGRIEQLKMALQARRIEADDIPQELRDRYLSEDGKARVEVSPAFSVESNEALRRFIEAVRSVAPNATGSPVVILEASRAVVNAILQAAAIAGSLILILLWVLLRNLKDTLLVFYPLALASLLTIGTMVVLDLPFNFANVIVLPLLMGLGVASGIHLVMRTRDARTEGALLETSTPRAVLFSALTTILSFGSLAVSDHRGTASMGELLAVSIGYTLICSLIALPALMAWLERGYFSADPDSKPNGHAG